VRPTALAAPLLAVALLAGCSGAASPTSTPSGSAGGENGAGETPATDIEAGDCYDPAASGDAAAVALVDCAAPHRYEAFASFVLTDAAYPGDALDAEARQPCIDAFADFVGIDYASSALALRYIAPSEGTWAEGDREVVCVVGDPAGPTSGSLHGTAR